LSLEVLQIHRASIVVTSPTEQPHIVEVGEEALVMVRLENQGNGQDTYRLSHEVVLDENLTEDPGVTVSFSNDMVSLGAGSLTNIPVTVVLSPSTPAGAPVDIMIHMTSMGDQSVRDSDSFLFQARQDHRWDISATRTMNITNSTGNITEVTVAADGATFPVAPGEAIGISVLATNEGNLMDGLELVVSYSISRIGEDVSQNWSSSGDSVTGIEVNQSTPMTVQASVPEDAWNGSVMSVSVTAEAQGVVMNSFNFSVEVTHVSGWGVIADQVNLEIEPDGSSISLTVVQLGNSPTEAWPTVWVKGRDWEVDFPVSTAVISPGETAPMILNITPSNTAQHGRAVELWIRLRDGDGSGATEISLPLSVAEFHNFSLTGRGNWVSSAEGGHPLAELQNLGNSPTTITLLVKSLPNGWEVSGQTEVVLGVGEVKGLPLELIPSADWDGSMQTISIEAVDEEDNRHQVFLDTEQYDYSWASSPIIVAMSGDHAIVRIHGTDESSSVIDSASGQQLDWHDSGGWSLPAMSSGAGSLNVGGSDLTYYAHVTQPSLRAADCGIQGDLAAVVAQCSVLNGTDSFSFTILLVDDQGVMLDSYPGSVSGGSGIGPINLSAETWSPEPGMRVLTLRLLDGRGVEVATADGVFEVRRTDWNIGLVDLELDGEGAEQKIRVLTKRGDGVGAMLDQYNADCMLSVVSGDYSMTHRVDLTGTFSPTLGIDRPGSAEDGDEIVVTIGCAFPWDVDSDPSDDESRIILSGGQTDPSKYNDMGTSLAAALLVIGVSVALAWMVRNYREGKELMEMAMAAAEEKMVEQKVAREVIEEEDVPPDEEEELQTPEPNPESPDEDDFEARLKRLMRD
jgi:hypothetical protein